MNVADAVDLVDSFRDLGPGWDSYQGNLINLRAIDIAKDLIRKLGDGWYPVPCSGGGIQLERHDQGVDMELTIDPTKD